MKVEITKEIKELIEDNALALATIGGDGNPHCIAVGFAKVVSENRILATDINMVETRENIQKNPNVSLVVWGKEWKEDCIWYRFKGTAQYFTSGEWHQKVKEIPENEDESCKGAILITINNIKKLA